MSDHSHRRRADPWLIATVLCAVAIVVLGLAPTQPVVVAVAPERETMATTIGHFVEFATLSALAAVSLRGVRRREVALIVPLAFSIALGGCLELAQAFLPYRDGQAYDAVVNALGGATGLALATFAAKAGRWSPRSPRA